MLPSNTSPTTSPRWFTTGEPELPPMMSLLVTKLNCTSGASLAFAVSHDFGSANGSVPVWRAKAPAMVVNGPTRAPLSS